MTFSPQVRAALAAVDEDHYTLRPDGTVVTQTTAARTIARMLDELDVRPGNRVLEIGTGSGFSGALLSELVGATGSVVSMDVMADLVDRAQGLHARRGRGNIELLAGDGRKGAPGHGPFDRIVAWATVERVPRAWVDQAAPGAVLVVPVNATPETRTNAIARLHTEPDGTLAADSLFPGGYVEMHDEVLIQWLVPPRGVDALVHDTHGHPWWVSTPWAANDGSAARRMLQTLATATEAFDELLTDEESGEDFTAFLYATRPEGLSVVGLGLSGWRLGSTSPVGAALFNKRDGSDTLHAGDPSALTTLREWVQRWRDVGRPGYGDLRPVLHAVDDGWTLRAKLRTTG